MFKVLGEGYDEKYYSYLDIPSINKDVTIGYGNKLKETVIKIDNSGVV